MSNTKKEKKDNPVKKAGKPVKVVMPKGRGANGYYYSVVN